MGKEENCERVRIKTVKHHNPRRLSSIGLGTPVYLMSVGYWSGCIEKGEGGILLVRHVLGEELGKRSHTESQWVNE